MTTTARKGSASPARSRVRDYARYGLAGVRLATGTAALLAPGQLARRMGVDPGENGPALYALRLFGIRTVLIGADVLLLRGDALARSLGSGLVIHASDALAAAAAGARGQLPKRGAMTATLISTANLGFALAARSRSR